MSSIMLSSLNNMGKENSPKAFNIVEDYPWTLTPKSNRKWVPHIVLVEFEQDVTSIYASLNYWLTQTTRAVTNAATPNASWTNVDNPYEGMYSAKATGAYFIFPYFEEYDHDIGQMWSDGESLDKNVIMAQVLTKITGVVAVTNQSPGVNINKPKKWVGENAAGASYSFSFHLFNTVGEEQVILDNMHLRNRLLMSTLHDQRNIMLVSPPAIFSVAIPGIRYCPAAVISHINVANVGQMNFMNLKTMGRGENVPDAYKITITIQELIPESRQILQASYNQSYDSVVAIDQTNYIEKVKATMKDGGVAMANQINKLVGGKEVAPAVKSATGETVGVVPAKDG